VLLGGDGGEAHRRPSDLDSPLGVWRTTAAARDHLQDALCALDRRNAEPFEFVRTPDGAIGVDRTDVDDDQSHREPVAQGDCCEQRFAPAS
jgi:hypothetical protein